MLRGIATPYCLCAHRNPHTARQLCRLATEVLAQSNAVPDTASTLRVAIAHLPRTTTLASHMHPLFCHTRGAKVSSSPADGNPKDGRDSNAQ
jgi:hypothetical protein